MGEYDHKCAEGAPVGQSINKGRDLIRLMSKSIPGILFVFLLLALVGCTLLSSDENEENGSVDSLQLTEVALGVEQTLIARQETSVAQTFEADQDIPKTGDVTPQPTPDMAVTESVMQSTPSDPQASPTTQALPADFENHMKSASILLYEDIVNNPEVYRYIRQTLERMGLPYTDVGSAKGRFKDALLTGTPSGNPWDLIIVAAEARTGIQGEFFEYINNSLDQGSSVVLEAYHLDEISSGKASLILNRCGVSVKNYAGNNRSPSDIMLYPVNDPGHPILNHPNSGISLTEGLTFFWDYNDLGSTMDITGEGDGLFLLARSPSDTNRNGVLAICADEKLILQTFSSHSFDEEIMGKLWQNYIYHALKVRLLGST